MSPSEIHNKLANEFVQMAGRQTESSAELMVVAESAILATMHLLVRLHGLKPSHASTMMEAALQRATERFAGAPQ